MKVKAFVLLILVISSSLFYYGYFDVMLLHSKSTALDKLAAAAHNHSLTLLKVPASQQNDYGDDEISVNGNLYDVAEREIGNDTLYLSLYHDTDEQSVVSAIGDFFKTDDASVSSSLSHSSLKSVRTLYNPQYYFDILQFSLQLIASKNKRFHSNTALLSSAFQRILTPPPKLSYFFCF